MKDKETGFTTDHTGKSSMMRVMSAAFGGTSVIIALVVTASIYQGQGSEHMIGVYLSLLFLLAATAPKALQKYIELVFENELPEAKAQD